MDTWGLWAMWEATRAWSLEHKLLALFLVLSVLDVITGTSAAAIQHRLSSKISWAGANRKFLTYCAIFLAVAMDQLGSSFTNELPLAAPIIAFYTVREFLSNLENLKAGGLPIPPLFNGIVKRLAETQSEPPPERERGPVL